jgi:hypothetical protein
VRVVSSGDLTAGAASIVRFGGSNSATSGYIGYGGTGSTIDIWNTLNGSIVFGTNSTERMRIDASGNLRVGTAASPRLNVDGTSTSTYTGGVRATRQDFYSFLSTAEFGGAARYVHMKTNIQTNGTTQMFAIGFDGYSYGEVKNIDSRLGFYSYPPSNAVISIASSGTHTCSAYKSADNFVVMTILITSFYFPGYSLSQYYTAQGNPFDVSVTSVTLSASATGVY